MHVLERIVIVYAAAFGLLATVGPRRSRSWKALAVSLVTIATAVLVARAPLFLRLLAPNFYLVAGYWLPALVVPSTAAGVASSPFERWLAHTDALLRPRLPAVPAPIATLTETAYLLCYPVVPVSLALVWLTGGTDAVPRFWITVLLSGLACYVSLPWLLSRPPDRTGLHTLPLRRVNRFVLARVSHSWTTFPSGHVAVSWAAALAVSRVSLAGGLFLMAIALGVTVGAAAGRYHYVVDVLLGVVVAVAVVVIT